MQGDRGRGGRGVWTPRPFYTYEFLLLFLHQNSWNGKIAVYYTPG